MKEKTKDVLGTVAFWMVITGVAFIWMVGIYNIVTLVRNCKSSTIIIDRETVTTASRPALVYLESEHQWFLVGSVLTSKENGELIQASPDTPPDEIVGIVSDSGTIEHYNPE